MRIHIRQFVIRSFLVAMSLLFMVQSVLGQEEAEAAVESAGGGPGWMIAIVGIGLLVILGLGGAIAAQQADEQAASDASK